MSACLLRKTPRTGISPRFKLCLETDRGRAGGDGESPFSHFDEKLTNTDDTRAHRHPLSHNKILCVSLV